MIFLVPEAVALRDRMNSERIHPRGWRPGPPGLGCPAPGASFKNKTYFYKQVIKTSPGGLRSPGPDKF